MTPLPARIASSLAAGAVCTTLLLLHLQSLTLAEPIPPATWRHLTALTALTFRDVTEIPPPGDEHAHEVAVALSF